MSPAYGLHLVSTSSPSPSPHWCRTLAVLNGSSNSTFEFSAEMGALPDNRFPSHALVLIYLYEFLVPELLAVTIPFHCFN